MGEPALKSSQNYAVKESINGMMASIKGIIPIEISFGPPSLIQSAFHQRDIGVLIGLTGDLGGQVLIEGDLDAFSSVAEVMFGMKVEGEMLESFVGEFGNMVSGNMATHISNSDIILNISPPTVVVGGSKFTAFEKGIKMSVTFNTDKVINIIMMMKKESE
ncbi:MULTISPECIES: chemotaxis protein CheX [Bacillaceae]|uniref:Chemotaxis protein CheX n=1 Tax=Evansella alkalicola TaxID=745819 RepID=A0ABS6JT65_9BACI|nr:MULTISPECIES: chemotaxis protein CheX [Bacillaceae]MBU9721768.1 chemotaxis protein CheX [Bacillus alkalicola]